MRNLGTAVLTALLLIPLASSGQIDRTELEGNVSLIITYPGENYTILSLVNKNDFNVTLVEDIQINFPYDIDPASIQAFDNNNQRVIPDEIKARSIIFTYNNTLPALGYGKIFLDSAELVPTPTPEARPTISPPPTPLSNTAPPKATSPPIDLTVNQTEDSGESSAPLDEKSQVNELALVTLGLIIFLLLAILAIFLFS